MRLLQIRLLSDLPVYGYSQGGHAAMATAQKVHENQALAQAFNIKALIVANAPYMLHKTAYDGFDKAKNYFNGEDGHNRLLGLAATQHVGVLPFPSVGMVMNPPYDSLYNVYVEHLGGEIHSHLPKNWRTIFRASFLNQVKTDTSVAFWRYLAKNDVYNWANPYPTYFLYGRYDEHIPYKVSLLTRCKQQQCLKEQGISQVKHLKTVDLSKGGLVWFSEKMNHRTMAIFAFLFAL